MNIFHGTGFPVGRTAFRRGRLLLMRRFAGSDLGGRSQAMRAIPGVLFSVRKAAAGAATLFGRATTALMVLAGVRRALGGLRSGGRRDRNGNSKRGGKICQRADDHHPVADEISGSVGAAVSQQRATRKEFGQLVPHRIHVLTAVIIRVNQLDSEYFPGITVQSAHNGTLRLGSASTSANVVEAKAASI